MDKTVFYTYNQETKVDMPLKHLKSDKWPHMYYKDYAPLEIGI